MEELADSRRAAFEAIVDCGCRPILYENVRVRKGGSDPIQRARQIVDQLLSRSDMLLVVLFQTLGEPLRQFSGLTAVEYEFYRFLIQLKLLSNSNPSSPQKKQLESRRYVLDKLDELFVSGDSPGASLKHEIAIIDEQLHLLRAFKDIEGRFGLQQKTILKVLKTIDSRSCVPGTSYFRLFRRKILITELNLAHSHPLNSRLIDFVGQKPQETFRAEIRLDDDRVLYFPASDSLYGIVEGWLRPCRMSRTENPVRWTHKFRINTHGRPGELLRIFDVLFRYGLNIDNIAIGFDESGRCAQLTCESLPGENGLCTSPRELDKIVIRDIGSAASQAPEIGFPLLKQDHSPDFLLRIRQANVPGMLFRVGCVIANSGMNIEFIRRLDPQGEEPADRTTRILGVRHSARRKSDDDNLSRLIHQLRNMIGVHSCSIAQATEAETTVRLGECLVILGALSQQNLSRVLREQKNGELTGATAVRLGLASEQEIKMAVERQNLCANLSEL